MTRHLLVIGAQRSGTTYLHDLLAAHPDIAMARPSRPEPKVFLSDEVVARGRGWYLRTYFGHATGESVLGEKSTSYLEVPAATARAAAVLGDPLVVALLRDPVRRAVSHWAFSTASGLETRPLRDALAANLDGPIPWDPARTSVSPFAYLERGRYVHDLRPWIDRFGDHVTILLLDDLVRGPEALTGLYGVLGVEPGVRPEALGRPVNQSRRRGDLDALEAPLRSRLRTYFGDSDAELAALLGRPLPWTDGSP